MGPNDDIALSFDAAPGMSMPTQKRGNATQPGFQNQPPFRQPPPPPMMRPAPGPGPSSSGLPFLPFDLGASSSSTHVLPPRVSYGAPGYNAFEDEPPLLEELGIDISQISRRTLAVLNPLRVNPQLHEEADLSGPFIFLILFGLFQFLAQKVHFGVIIGWSTLASAFLYAVFNMLAGKNGSLDFHRCFSLIGYCLVPMVLFSASAIFLPVGPVRGVLAAVAIIWCTRACTSLLVELVLHADEHRCVLLYIPRLPFWSFLGILTVDHLSAICSLADVLQTDGPAFQLASKSESTGLQFHLSNCETISQFDKWFNGSV